MAEGKVVAECTANSPVWEGVRDFGNGERRYRCIDLYSQIGESRFEYFNSKFGWRQVRNLNVRFEMHKFVSAMDGGPF